jgi:hemerythrin
MLTHANEIKKLTPEDFALIEQEHLRLAGYMDRIHETCCFIAGDSSCNNCGREKMASCSGRLTSFLIDIVNVAEEHFYHEEKIMLKRSSDIVNSEYFIAHQQAHYEILLQLESLGKVCYQFDKTGKTVEAYRYLYQQLKDIFSAHDLQFDNPFIQSVEAA